MSYAIIKKVATAKREKQNILVKTDKAIICQSRDNTLFRIVIIVIIIIIIIVIINCRSRRKLHTDELHSLCS
jgi:hypothetical protein